MYDSPNFRKSNVNPDHKYAIQPLIYKYANADGYTDFVDGLTPDIEIEESYYNLGQLGDLDEPLLARTIEAITGINRNSMLPEKKATIDSRKLFMAEEKSYLIGSNKLPGEILDNKANLNN